MLTNRLVRALVGAVVAQASVAAAWYLYKQEQKFKDKNEDNASDDMNALNQTPSAKTVEVTDGVETKKPEVVEKTPEASVTQEVKQDKPKAVRKPRAAKKVPNETTVAAIAEAEKIVTEKKTRRTTPVKKEMFVASETTAKPARKRSPVAKKAEATVEATETKKPARKRTSKKV